MTLKACEQDCGRAARYYAGGRSHNDWAGYYCSHCTEALKFTVMEDLAVTFERKAAEGRERAEASFDQSDTDGFRTQSADRLIALKERQIADLIRKDGVSHFPALFDLDGNWQPAKAITTKYGVRWMLLTAEGRATGEFLPYFPKRRSTLADKGFVEGFVVRPAKVELVGETTVMVAVLPADEPHQPPIEIVTTDRWS